MYCHILLITLLAILCDHSQGWFQPFFVILIFVPEFLPKGARTSFFFFSGSCNNGMNYIVIELNSDRNSFDFVVICFVTDLTFVPDLAVKLEEIPVNPCFALMLAFSEPLSLDPSFKLAT